MYERPEMTLNLFQELFKTFVEDLSPLRVEMKPRDTLLNPSLAVLICLTVFLTLPNSLKNLNTSF